MSYQQRRSIVSVVAGIIVLTAYCIYTTGQYQSGAAALDDLKFWAGVMLVFIGIGIVATIVIQIVFHILLSIATAVREQMQTGQCDDKEIEKRLAAEMVEDEMDKLVELKSMRVSFIVVGIGFVTSLVVAYLSFPVAVIINIMFLSFLAGSVFDGISRLYFYKKGIRYG